MRILFNHSLSSAADTITMMRRSRPGLFVIATHERNDTPIRAVADRFLPEPAAVCRLDAEGYADWLLSLAQAEKADVVIPYRRREQLAAFRDIFKASGIRLLTASDEGTMRHLEDKPAFLQEMQDHGVAVSPFRLFTGIASYENLRNEGNLFPDHPGDLCVKPASGIYGAGFRILRDQLPKCAAFADLSSAELLEPAFQHMLAAISDPEPMMLMPLLPGPERSVDFACFEGQLLGSVTRTKSKTSQRLYHDPDCEAFASLVAQRFNLSGILNLQTIEDASGCQRLLEVNSRASGGIGMTALTNVNLPELLLKALEAKVEGAPKRVIREKIVGRQDVFWDVDHPETS